MELSMFNKFYKNVAKEFIDNDTGGCESVHCEHIINYTSQHKQHEFSVKADDNVELYISATVHREQPWEVIKWDIKHRYNSHNEKYELDAEYSDTDEDIIINYINRYNREPESKLPINNIKIENNIKDFINNMMINGIRF